MRIRIIPSGFDNRVFESADAFEFDPNDVSVLQEDLSKPSDAETAFRSR